ncbi:MAG: UvrD-helicase domain-containing protein [Bacteroidetes bacterium]|nr:UvrD-helicase domain-containing protein [Bacteroidota bacterium]
MNNILEGLNSEQQKAVTHINGPLQIIAGAGSGKTLVITRRIAYLLEQGISPYNILALTFTNKAANEMKTRIFNLLDIDSHKSDLWVGTFHSLFARILRIEAYNNNLEGYNENFSIYDEEDAEKIIKQINDTIDVKNSQVNPKYIYTTISSLKNQCIYPDVFSQMASTSQEKYIAEIYKLYQPEFKKNNAMDFDDLLLNTLNLFETRPDILEKYQNRFKYILVDEYQDTNNVQYRVISKLAERYKNICIVGDDAQSIYKWRGADIQNILTFKDNYPDCKTIKLEQNYRSTGNILTAADNIISNNKRQFKKVLWTSSEAGEKIKLMRLNNAKDEANYIVNIIKQEHIKGKALKDFAVLYRTNAQSLQFEKECREQNLPYIIVGSTSFYKRKEIKDVIAYLRILINQKDKISFNRIINEPPRGIGISTVNKIKENYNTNEDYTIINLLNLSIQELNLRNSTRNTLEKFTNTLTYTFNKLIEYSQEKENTGSIKLKIKIQSDIIELLLDYLKSMNIIEYYKELDDLEMGNRLDNINQLLSDIINYLKADYNNTLANYLENISLISDDSDIKNKDAANTNQDVITLMTLHSSKGLEFDTVFIPGVEKSLIPLQKNQADDNNIDNIEEERRLFYVGITRAKKLLYLSYVTFRMFFGKTKDATPSMFLREIDPEIIEDITNNTFLYVKRNFETLPKKRSTDYGNKSSYNNKGIYNPKKEFPVFNDLEYEYSNYNSYSQIEEPAKPIKSVKHTKSYTNFHVGDTVLHKKFGQGRIMAFSGEGKNKKATIFFSLYGRKQLLLEYANLEKNSF